jgi:uncharacterized glyoxalase superfamily protein PhnB
MRATTLLLLPLLGLVGPVAAQSERPPMTQMQKLTPVFLVDRIAPCLPFWTERLGFEMVASVPGPDGEPQFAMLVKDGVELMYQTWRSVEEDIPAAAAGGRGQSTVFFLEVADLDAVEKALAGVPIVVPRRKTFYGKEEIVVREPAGALVVFAMDVK